MLEQRLGHRTNVSGYTEGHLCVGLRRGRGRFGRMQHCGGRMGDFQEGGGRLERQLG